VDRAWNVTSDGARREAILHYQSAKAIPKNSDAAFRAETCCIIATSLVCSQFLPLRCGLRFAARIAAHRFFVASMIALRPVALSRRFCFGFSCSVFACFKAAHATVQFVVLPQLLFLAKK